MKTALILTWTLFLSGFGAGAQTGKPATGLTGEYFSGPNFERKVLTRIDRAVDFDWNWQSPGPGVPREYFSVRWTGKLYAPETGTYRFSALADDGVRVWINGRKVIDEWRKQDDSQFVGEIVLNGRRLYDLRIEYYNDWKGSTISVYWELPGQKQRLVSRSGPRQIISANYLVPMPAVRPKDRRITPVSRAVATKKLSAQRVASVTTVRKPVVRPTATAAVVEQISSPASVTPVESDVLSFAELKPGSLVVLRHVYFSQGDYMLLPASATELNELVRTLQANPALTIDVVGHTDNVGDQRLNMALSENRAKVVASYLIRHGIASGRVTPKGYGGTKPIAGNDTEADRSLNRRVELAVH